MGSGKGLDGAAMGGLGRNQPFKGAQLLLTRRSMGSGKGLTAPRWAASAATSRSRVLSCC